MLDQGDGLGVERWLSDGWHVLDEIVPGCETEAAMEEVFRLVPTAAEYHRNPVEARARWGRSRTRQHEGIVPDGPDFRPEQFRWESRFPFPDSPGLNRLCIHPRLVDFVKSCLGTDDVRLYQAGLDVKYFGDTDYEQPLHIDSNHSLLPPSPDRRWRHLEGFLYLTDVGAATGATQVVGRESLAVLLEGEPVSWPTVELERVRTFLVPGRVFPHDRHPELYARERPAVGRRGSFLAYGPDVVHRGASITEPGSIRVLLNLSFRTAAQEWVGFHTWQPGANDRPWREFMVGRTPDELRLFGFPPPGHPVWDGPMIEHTSARYPGLDMQPWRDTLS